MTRILVEAFSPSARHEVIHLIERIIAENGGWVVDHRIFSHESITLDVEINSLMIENIIHDLNGLGLKINSTRIMDQLSYVNPGKESYIVNLSFIVNFTPGDYQTIKVGMPASQDPMNKI